jgi:hypothetical protein
LCAPENGEALSNAWLAALSDPDRLTSDGLIARRRVASTFGVRAMVDAYEGLYQCAFDSAGRRR